MSDSNVPRVSDAETFADFTPEQIQLATIRGVISMMPPEERAAILNCHSQLRQIVEINGDAGKMALALMGVESAAEMSHESQSESHSEG